MPFQNSPQWPTAEAARAVVRHRNFSLPLTLCTEEEKKRGNIMLCNQYKRGTLCLVQTKVPTRRATPWKRSCAGGMPTAEGPHRPVWDFTYSAPCSDYETHIPGPQAQEKSDKIYFLLCILSIFLDSSQGQAQ